MNKGKNPFGLTGEGKRDPDKPHPLGLERMDNDSEKSSKPGKLKKAMGEALKNAAIRLKEEYKDLEESVRESSSNKKEKKYIKLKEEETLEPQDQEFTLTEEEPEGEEEQETPAMTLEEELLYKKAYISNLITESDNILEAGGEQNGRETPDTLLASWKYALAQGELENLREVFEETAAETVREEEENSKALLERWMKRLKEMGVSKVDGDSAEITVSSENRAYYENGGLFTDGCVCEITRYPWNYKGEVYVRGRLKPLEKAVEKSETEIEGREHE